MKAIPKMKLHEFFKWQCYLTSIETPRRLLWNKEFLLKCANIDKLIKKRVSFVLGSVLSWFKKDCLI